MNNRIPDKKELELMEEIKRLKETIVEDTKKHQVEINKLKNQYQELNQATKDYDKIKANYYEIVDLINDNFGDSKITRDVIEDLINEREYLKNDIYETKNDILIKMKYIDQLKKEKKELKEHVLTSYNSMIYYLVSEGE